MGIVSIFNQGRIPHARMLAHPETYVMIHFGINTFTDHEWGYGDKSPALFNPDDFNADAILEAVKAGGFGGVILVCKHHDGFCLWPTRTTDYNISRSPWREGQGDLVREFVDAAHRAGLRMGFYVSPWDRNSAAYGSEEYVKIYREQLREICTQYGPAFEIWFDGANGGDGYYGGARTSRKAALGTYYGWRETWGLVRSLQPDAALFSDVGPDVRFVGNESGCAAPDCFASITPRLPEGVADGDPAPSFYSAADADRGHADGKFYMPPECDVPLRPGWFYHESEDHQLRSVNELVRIYLASVGAGGYLNLGLSPNRHGRLHPDDAARLREFGVAQKAIFADRLFEETLSGIPSGELRSLRFSAPVQVNLLDYREPEGEGERIMEYSIELCQAGEVVHTIAGHAVGRRRLRFFLPVQADEWRFRAVTADGKPLDITLAGYAAPEEYFRDEARRLALTNRPDYRAMEQKPKETETNLLWELDAPTRITGFVFVPLPQMISGTPERYQIEIRTPDGKWQVAASGEFANLCAHATQQTVEFPEPVECTAVRLTGIHVIGPLYRLQCREFGLLMKK